MQRYRERHIFAKRLIFQYTSNYTTCASTLRRVAFRRFAAYESEQYPQQRFRINFIILMTLRGQMQPDRLAYR